MAASTRVEKIEYKEIPTPKWRIAPQSSAPKQILSPEILEEVCFCF